MRIEAFTEAKRPDAPDTNEDALLILPGRAYAVLDGVSDRAGHRYDGMLSGRYASQLLRRRLEEMLGGADAPLDDPHAVLAALVAAIRGVYDRLGTTETVRCDWNLQMASTLALVMLSGDTAHILRVGDSGVRLNGETLLLDEKDLDRITATLRQIAWAPIAARVADAVERERLSRLVTWSGTRHAADAVAHVLTLGDLDAIEQETMAVCLRRLPHVPHADVERMVQGGIVHGQGGYQNDTSSVLGYPSLNGFDIPPAMIRVDRVKREELHRIELFSDGYFALGAGFGVAAWEATFAEVERTDPHKVRDYPSPKGSAGGLWADDRTYLGVEFRGA